MKIIDLIFAKKCIICSKKHNDICNECLKNAQKFYIHEKLSDGVICAYEYKEPLRKAFLRYKFNGKKSYVYGLSKLFLEKLKDVNLLEFDIITYIPISKNRMRERGFNQCKLICEEICKDLSCKPENILSKKNAKKQSSLSASERKVNIIDTFTLKKDVSGKRILVIDDVYTTGATINEAILEIKKGNPLSVTACVLFKS